MYFVYVYCNRTMKHVEIVLRWGQGDKRNDGGDESKKHCTYMCAYHNDPTSVQLIHSC
jgi:hypothetical protein